MRLLLASTSPYRRALLERLGVPFDGVAPACDEAELKKDIHGPPSLLACQLARAKAESLRQSHPDAVILAGDQVCCIGDEVLDKPGSMDRASQQLQRLQGRRHELLTAVCILPATPDAAPIEHLDRTTLHMRELTDVQIQRYLEFDRPHDCAGSYKLESRGIALFDRIESEDHTAVTGMPLLWLTRALAELGFSLP